jgi:hypothetical protein
LEGKKEKRKEYKRELPTTTGDKSMPVKGYVSVNVPSGLYDKIKALVKSRGDLGYRSVTEFVAEAVRTKLIEIGETKPKR